MHISIFLILITLFGCTTVRHKSISHTYHGTNGSGGHWMLWRMPNKISGDSVAISASGFNVSNQEQVQKSVLVVVSKKESIIIRHTANTPSNRVKLPAGRYQLFYKPIYGGNIGVRTKFYNFRTGDAITLQANIVNVDRHLHEDWNAKYLTPKQKARRDRKIDAYLNKLDKLRAKGKFNKAVRLQIRKAKRWPYVY